MRPEKTHGSASQKGERNLTRLCQGCLLYFANITSVRPFSSRNFRNYLRMMKSQLLFKQICFSSIISNVTNKEDDL